MKAVILAGGLGTRLKPFSQVIPKPLLPIGDSSVIETQILNLKKNGVTEIVIATNYLSDYIKAYITGKKNYGIEITISNEEKPLGTCGPITLVRSLLDEPFILMNGDILTTLDYKKFYNYAINSDADLIVGTKNISSPFEFGKIISDGDYIIDVEEKPNLKMEILAGIYIIKPPVLEIIPNDTYYGIDTLIKDMIKEKKKIAKYLIKEYWLDIGRVDDYETAQKAYDEHFKENDQ
jgi:NDP-mannose synthase